MGIEVDSSKPTSRIHSLDQFRGYTVLGMFFVNFIGAFRESAPPLFLHHNTYCSYADTIMPGFLFAVGFALRLVMLREVERHGVKAAMVRGLRRGWALVVAGIVVYGLDGRYSDWVSLQELGVSGFFAKSFIKQPIQALTHIGLTSLWILPVIARPARTIVLFAFGSAVLHLSLSAWFWFDGVYHGQRGLGGIDGGMLGFLSWTICAAAGAVAHDWRVRGASASLRPAATGSAVLMLLGYAISCIGIGGPIAAPPFLAPNGEVDMWTMTQRAGSVSYMVFASGFSLGLYALFVLLCDLRPFRLGVFSDLGKNAFGAYVLHLIAMNVWGDFGPRDGPLWYALLYTITGCAFCWVGARWLNQRGLIFRL